ncbi:type-F conjugative transfer system secretin TraK, partial [Aeromonas salmonicida subsp. salmonicida]|nr:type-F conjugative transfer system secretin TraK [Aeromonas salmonicida subsp. salmonicida]
ETAQPYESMLVALNRALPEGYGPASIDKEAPFTRAGLQATPDSAWDGNALHIVRYRLTNPLSVPVVLREPDFWMPGTRAIMVHPRYQRLIAGASTWLYVIRTQEHTDGQH